MALYTSAGGNRQAKPGRQGHGTSPCLCSFVLLSVNNSGATVRWFLRAVRKRKAGVPEVMMSLEFWHGIGEQVASFQEPGRSVRVNPARMPAT